MFASACTTPTRICCSCSSDQSAEPARAQRGSSRPGQAAGRLPPSLGRRRAAALRLAGLAAAGAGGYLGGHIAYRQSAGANQAEPVPHLVEPGWHDLLSLAEFGELDDHEPVRRMLGDVPVVLIRDGARLHVLSDRCSHLSGPLSDGEYHDGCLTFPWHGSTFRVSDGGVARGPATAPQPAFLTRTADGMLQVCLPGAG